MLDRLPANQMTHDRGTAEPMDVIDVLVITQTEELLQPQHTRERVTAILAGAIVVQQSGSKIRQPECIVQLAMDQQSVIGTVGRTPE